MKHQTKLESFPNYIYRYFFRIEQTEDCRLESQTIFELLHLMILQLL